MENLCGDGLILEEGEVYFNFRTRRSLKVMIMA